MVYGVAEGGGGCGSRQMVYGVAGGRGWCGREFQEEAGEESVKVGWTRRKVERMEGDG